MVVGQRNLMQLSLTKITLSTEVFDRILFSPAQIDDCVICYNRQQRNMQCKASKKYPTKFCWSGSKGNNIRASPFFLSFFSKLIQFNFLYNDLFKILSLSTLFGLITMTDPKIQCNGWETKKIPC